MLRWLTAASAACLAVAGGLIVFYAPVDALQGPVQKIFYVHVPAVIAAYCMFATVLVGSVLYLWRGSARADRAARAAAPVGLVLTCTTLAMGIVWAEPIWNWDPTKPWDARFTSTVVLAAVYAGYILVRRFAAPGASAARLAAVVGIIGFIDVPVVHFSVQWWRTLHPGRVIDAPGGPALPPQMLTTFMVTLVAILVLAATLFAARYRIERLREDAERDAAGAPVVAAPAVAARP